MRSESAGRDASRSGFTVTEVLVVIGVVILLLGLLFPVLAAFRKSGLMTKSMSNMRQVATWMHLYSSDNRDFIVPSRFNYIDDAYPGKVRSVIMHEPLIGREHAGTWADILWTVFEVGVFPEAAMPRPEGLGHDYRYDSPDGFLYKHLAGTLFENPLRSAEVNSRNTHTSLFWLPTPYGGGASEAGLPGYFAANNFFNADPDATDPDTLEPVDANWYTNTQIRMPDRSMYLVDSFAGETIEARPEPYQISVPETGPGSGDDPTGQVDFRYADVGLMLFLDGHSETVTPWDEICDLEGPGGRNIRIRDLTKRSLRADECPGSGGGGPGDN